ncbi:MAG: hypothetical protein KJI71_05400, partial [Patescibacteria group bacterium]|nr:hypothetical protein [Patescibacteria group bacterium]
CSSDLGEKLDLPRGRDAKEWEIDVGGVPLHVIASEYGDGKPGQIAFLSYKGGETMAELLRVSGIEASAALKRGVSLEDAVKSWIGHSFQPNGLVVGHSYIKDARSLLDAAGKVLMLEYMGRKEFAKEPDKVDITKLRGFKSGSLRAYRREQVDDWNVKQVLRDYEFGGFVEPGEDDLLENGKESPQGVGIIRPPCPTCGRLMNQTKPNCYSCTCGFNRGGCVA